MTTELDFVGVLSELCRWLGCYVTVGVSVQGPVARRPIASLAGVLTRGAGSEQPRRRPAALHEEIPDEVREVLENLLTVRTDDGFLYFPLGIDGGGFHLEEADFTSGRLLLMDAEPVLIIDSGAVRFTLSPATPPAPLN